jgi:probable rRNA maturation factor
VPDPPSPARQPRAPRRRSGLEIAVVEDRGRPVAAPGLAAWLRKVAPPRARGSLTIALVSDARMRTLNRRYRNQDHVTDVLSFPNPIIPLSAIPNRKWSLGDVVIAQGAVRRQARAARHPEATELRILALHGLLHLMGYDHERDNGGMRRAEQRLRRKGGLVEGLIERSAGNRAGRR